MKRLVVFFAVIIVLSLVGGCSPNTDEIVGTYQISSKKWDNKFFVITKLEGDKKYQISSYVVTKNQTSEKKPVIIPISIEKDFAYKSLNNQASGLYQSKEKKIIHQSSTQGSDEYKKLSDKSLTQEEMKSHITQE